MPFPHIEAFITAYVSPPFVASDPHVSPGLTPDAELLQALKTGKSGEKKVFFVSGEKDNITKQVKTLATRLQGLGIDATYSQ